MIMDKDWYDFIEEEKEKKKIKEGRMYPDEKGSIYQRKYQSNTSYDGRSGFDMEQDYN